MGLFPELDKFESAKSEMESWILASGGYNYLSDDDRTKVDDWYDKYTTNRGLRVDDLAQRVGAAEGLGVKSMSELRQAVQSGHRFSDSATALAQLPDEPVPTRARERKGRPAVVPVADPEDVPPSESAAKLSDNPLADNPLTTAPSAPVPSAMERMRAAAVGPETAPVSNYDPTGLQQVVPAAGPVGASDALSSMMSVAQGPAGPDQALGPPMGPVMHSRLGPDTKPPGFYPAPSGGVLGFGDPRTAAGQYWNIAAHGLARTESQMRAYPAVSSAVAAYEAELGQNTLARFVLEQPERMEQVASQGFIDITNAEFRSLPADSPLSQFAWRSPVAGHYRLQVREGLEEPLTARGVEFELAAPGGWASAPSFATSNLAQLAMALGDIASKTRAELAEEYEQRLESDPSYQAAKDVERLSAEKHPIYSEFFEPLPGTESDLALGLGIEGGVTIGDVGEGVISTAPFFFGGAAGAAIAGPAGAALGLKAGAAATAGAMIGAAAVARTTQPVSEFQEALRGGAGFGEAAQVLHGSKLISLTEVAPVGVLFSRLDKIVGKGAVRQWLMTVGIESVTEMAQEMLSEFGHNALNKAVWDTTRELGEGVARSGLIGFLTGGLVGGVASAPALVAELRPKKPEPEQDEPVAMVSDEDVTQLLGEVQGAVEKATEAGDSSIIVGMLDALVRRSGQGDPLARDVLEAEVSDGVTVEAMLTEMVEGLSGPAATTPTAPPTDLPSDPAQIPTDSQPESPLPDDETLDVFEGPEPTPEALPPAGFWEGQPEPEVAPAITVHAEGTLVDLGDGLMGKVVETVERDGQVGHKVRAKGGEETWVWGELDLVDEAESARRLAEQVQEGSAPAVDAAPATAPELVSGPPAEGAEGGPSAGGARGTGGVTQPGEVPAAPEGESEVPAAPAPETGKSEGEPAGGTQGAAAEGRTTGRRTSLGAVGDKKLGADNTIITRDRFDENMDKLRDIFNSANMPLFNPEIYRIGMEAAIFYLESGVRAFDEFARKLDDDFSKLGADLADMRPLYASFYEGARANPDAKTEGMWSQAEVQGYSFEEELDDDQAAIFDAFVGHQAVAESEGAGVNTEGLSVMEGESIKMAGEPVLLNTDEGSGQVSEVVTLKIVETIRYRDFDFAEKYRIGRSNMEDPGLHFVLNEPGHKLDGMVFAAGATIKTFNQKKGKNEYVRHAIDTTGAYWALDAVELGEDPKRWRSIETVDEAKRLWNEYIAQAPQTRDRTRYLLTGMQPSIGDSVTDRDGNSAVGKIYRVTTNDGQHLIGREVMTRKVDSLLRKFGVDADAWQAGLPQDARKRELAPKQIVDLVLDGSTFDLDNGWRIRRSRVAHETRIEIMNPDARLGPADAKQLVKWGAVEMRIQYNIRVFVPTDDAVAIITRIMEGRKIQAERAVTDEADDNRLLSDIDKTFNEVASEIVPGIRNARPAQTTPRRAGEEVDYSPAPGIMLEYEVVLDDGKTVTVQRISTLGRPQTRRIPKRRFEVGVTRASIMDSVASAVWSFGRDPSRRHLLPPELQAMVNSPDPLMPDREFEERSLGDVRTDEQFGPKLPMSMEPIGEGVTPGVHQVMRAIQAIVPTVPLRVPIPRGRRRPGLRGYYDPVPKEARVDSFSNFTTAIHEMGHGLEEYIWGHAFNTPHFREMGRQIITELAELGHELYGEQRPRSGSFVREGYSEFLVYYIAKRESAQDKAPGYFELFESMLALDKPLKKSIEHATLMVRRYIEQGADMRSLRNMVTGSRGPTAWRLLLAAKKWELWTDNLNPLLDYDLHVKGIAGKSVSEVLADLGLPDHPSVHDTATRFTGAAPLLVKKFVEEGVYDLSGTNRVGESLTHWNMMALRDGTRWEFYGYIWARRSLERLGWHWNPEAEQFDRSMKLLPDGTEEPVEAKEPGMTLPDAQFLFLKYHDRPNFRRAAEGYYTWNKLILNYALEASLISPADRARILSGSGDFIPLRRMFDEIDESERNLIVSAVREGRPIPRFRGSGRRVIEPMLSMIENAERLIRLSHRAKVLQMVIVLSELESSDPRKPGMGQYITKVPANKMPITFSVDKIAGMLERAGVIDQDTLSQSELETVLTIFVEKPITFQVAGGRPIIPHWHDGQVDWYEIDPDLYRALTGMDMYRMETLRGFLSRSKDERSFTMALAGSTVAPLARTFRLGTTGINASFSLVTNPIRDFPTFLFNSTSWGMREEYSDRSYYGHLGWLTKLWVQEWWAAARHAFGGERSPAAEIFHATGGPMSMPLGIDTKHTRRAADEAWWKQTGFNRKARSLFSRNFVDHLRDLFGFPETATRAAEVRAIAELLGIDISGATVLTLQQTTLMGLGGRNVTVNFAAGGSISKEINAVTPFFGANVQGVRVVAQTFKRDKWSALLRGLHLSILTAVLWLLVHDEPWYRRMKRREKWAFFNIPVPFTNEILRIPRPFDIGNLFSVLPEAMLEAQYMALEDDPEWWNQLYSALEHTANTTMPPIPYYDNPAWLWAREQNKNEVEFWGGPVSPQDANPFSFAPTVEDVTPWTSSGARGLGWALPPYGEMGVDKWWKSPARLEHTFRRALGPTGITILRFPDYFLVPFKEGQGGEFETADIPLGGRIVWRGGEAGIPTQAAQDMFDRLPILRRLKGSEKALMTVEDALELKNLEKLRKAYSELRKESRDPAISLDEKRAKLIEAAELVHEGWKTRFEK